MDELTTFVDAVYDCYDKSVNNLEDDQKLPPKDVLEEVCQVLLNVSCMREEGRFPSFRVCFVQPESELLDTYIYAHVLLFKNPIDFRTRDLHKLAPALNPDMSYLMLDIRQKPYKAVGIIAAYTSWEKIMTREISSGNRMPRIPNILVSGPGELRACFGESSIMNYNAGRCIFFRTDTFTSTLVADQLGNGTSISENDRLRLLYRVLWLPFIATETYSSLRLWYSRRSSSLVACTASVRTSSPNPGSVSVRGLACISSFSSAPLSRSFSFAESFLENISPSLPVLSTRYLPGKESSADTAASLVFIFPRVTCTSSSSPAFGFVRFPVPEEYTAFWVSFIGR